MPVLACCAWSRRFRLHGLISPPVWNTPMCGRAMSSSSCPSACRKLRVVARITPSRMVAERKGLRDGVSLMGIGAASVGAAARGRLHTALEARGQRGGGAHQQVGVEPDRDEERAEVQIALCERLVRRQDAGGLAR